MPITIIDLIDEKSIVRKKLNALEREFAGVGDRIATLGEGSEERYRASDKRRHILDSIGTMENKLIDIEARIEKHAHGDEE